MPHLLGVDLGLSTGLALYEHPGRLVWYRSRNFPNLTTLKRGIHALLKECPPLDCLVLEGHRALAERWKQAAGVPCLQVSAETWREALLIPRRRKDAATSKKSALEEAHRLIVASGLPRPTSLTHDAAEAILIGWWGTRQIWD